MIMISGRDIRHAVGDTPGGRWGWVSFDPKIYWNMCLKPEKVSEIGISSAKFADSNQI